jgi:hypothetical protein
LPSTAGLTRTNCAVIAPPLFALSRVGRTATQLPVVTSVNCAGVTSLIFVDGLKSTVAFPLCWVTWIASPDTEAIIPLTQALPFADADGEDVAAELVGPAAVEGWPVFDVVWDAPHAATDSAVAPVSVKIANRARRAGGRTTGIPNISVLSDRRPLCAGRPRNASHNWWRS